MFYLKKLSIATNFTAKNPTKKAVNFLKQKGLTLALLFIQYWNNIYLLGLLLELLNGPLVDTSTLVDQVTGGGRLARVDVTNDDNVDVSLFLSHVAGCYF